MQSLTIDPPVPFIVPPLDKLTIVLVGCGGTGSHLAQALARLAAHSRETGGPGLRLVFIDGDQVEMKNVGRQLFSIADIGRNKAQALAARFSAVFGLEIVAIPQMLGDTVLRADEYGIIVGAVDGAAGRRAIQLQLQQNHDWRLWLDCGNHESSGQICIGNALKRDQMERALQMGLCSALPAPSLLYPDLLKEAPVRARADCAAAVLDNAQGLMVNQMMAAIAGQYLYQVVIGRRLTTFCTAVDLESLSMRSDPITAQTLAEACGLTADQINGVQAKKKRRTA